MVIDIRLGAISGMVLIADLKLGQPRAPIVVLSNHAGPAHRQQCLNLGADFFFDVLREFESAVEVVVDARSVRSARAGM